MKVSEAAIAAIPACPVYPPNSYRNAIGSDVLIVLQKSKVAVLQILREDMNREAIADSYDLNRVTEVACEFYMRR